MKNKKYYLYVYAASAPNAPDASATFEDRGAHVLATRGVQVPEGVTPWVTDDVMDDFMLGLTGGPVIQAILLDGLRWATLNATVKIDIMKVAHRMLAVTKCRSFNVVLPDGTLDFALKAGW